VSNAQDLWSLCKFAKRKYVIILGHFVVIPVSIIILVKDVTSDSCKLWMQRRKENGPLNGLLEFPGGKLKSDETPAECAKREFLEETSTELSHVEQFKMSSFEYKDRKVCLFSFFANGEGVNPQNGEWFNFQFSDLSSDYKDKLPEANYEIVDEFLVYLKKHVDAGFLENIWVRTS
jgi:mutator protein MutT